jgi:D-alanine--poly(phosphoribitol) ligase subunit 2
MPTRCCAGRSFCCPSGEYMSTADEVIAALETITQEHEIAAHRDVNLFGQQILDSLRTVELVVELSERFGTEIALSEIDRESWATPNLIIAFMEQRVDHGLERS